MSANINCGEELKMNITKLIADVESNSSTTNSNTYSVLENKIRPIIDNNLDIIQPTKIKQDTFDQMLFILKRNIKI